MRATHRLGAAVVALLAAVLLGGCLKFDADITVTNDDTVDGTFVIGVSKQLLALTGQDAGEITDQIQADITDDAPEQGEYSSQPYEDDTFVGATVTFSDVPLDEFNAPGAEGADSSLTITRNGDQFEVAGELDFELSGIPGEEGFPNIDELLASSEPELSIAITFPGEVTSANGSIDGCTVTWEPSLTEATTFEATANDSGGCTESIKWWAWILIGLGVLVLIGGIVAIVRTIKKEKSRGPSSPPTGTATAAAPGAAVTAASTDELPPESTPLTMPPPEPPSPPDLPAPTAPPADAGSLPDLPGSDAGEAVDSGAVPELADQPGPPPDAGALPPPPPSGPAGFPPPEPRD